MNNIEQLNKYDFHDSLLENLFYNRETKELNLIIDFCNWKQSWYHDNEPETSIISLVFTNVSNATIPEYTPNSDEIMNFSLLEQNSGIKVTIFNDISNSLYDIIVYANEFEILK